MEDAALYFIIDGTELYMDTILVELDYPMLFTCLDKDGNQYLALDIERENMYIVMTLSDKELVDMITGSVTMHDIFRNAETAWYVTSEDMIRNDVVEAIPDMAKVMSEDLPKVGGFYLIPSPAIQNFLDKIKERTATPQE